MFKGSTCFQPAPTYDESPVSLLATEQVNKRT